MSDLSTIMVGETIYNLKDIESRKRVSASLLKDTVGWTGKNLLKNTATTQTVNGVTFTVNSDGSVSTSGTASATFNYVIIQKEALLYLLDYIGKEVILTGCPVGGSSSTYRLNILSVDGIDEHVNTDLGNGVTFTIGDFSSFVNDVFVAIRIDSGTNMTGLVFNPMIRRADITDDTYEPYHESVEECKFDRAEQAVLGAKNLLKIKYSTTTISDVTYTVNRDSKNNVISIVPTGTASANSYMALWNRTDDDPLKGLSKGVEYTISGDKGLGAGNGYVYVNFYTGSTRISGVNTGGLGSVNFTIPDAADYIDFGVGILNGKTVPTGFAFYPMLRLASDPDDTYVPYAMTNRELTNLPQDVFVTTDTRQTTTNNANDFHCGFVRLSDSNSNLPTSGSNVWYDVLTIRESNYDTSALWGYGFQMAVQTTSAGANFGASYIRAVNGGSNPTWSEWKKITP